MLIATAKRGDLALTPTTKQYASLLLTIVVGTTAVIVSMCDLVVHSLVPYVREGPGGVYIKSTTLFPIPKSNTFVYND